MSGLSFEIGLHRTDRIERDNIDHKNLPTELSSKSTKSHK